MNLRESRATRGHTYTRLASVHVRRAARGCTVDVRAWWLGGEGGVLSVNYVRSPAYAIVVPSTDL